MEIPVPAEATCPFVTGREALECLTAYSRSGLRHFLRVLHPFIFSLIKYFIDDYFISDVQLLVKHPCKTALFYFSSSCGFSLKCHYSFLGQVNSYVAKNLCCTVSRSRWIHTYWLLAELSLA